MTRFNLTRPSCVALLLLHLSALPCTSVPKGTIESAPLAPRKDAARADGFERLDAARTGLDFVHRWIPPHRYPDLRHILLSTSHAGGGVCIGDYDDDGLADVFLSRPHGGNRLYRNRSGFRFEDVTDEAGLAEVPGSQTWGTGATFVDIDDDGDLDLYVCAYDAPNRLYVNRGDGTFEQRAEAFGLAFKGASVCMAFADYDRDGDLDGYLLTNRIVSAQWKALSYRFRDGRPTMPQDHRESAKLLIHPDGHAEVVRAGQVDHLYRNNGDGSFTDVTAQALGNAADANHFGLSATWWDPDNDGWPDLYVANDFWGPDHLYHNNGDGTFTDVIRTALPHTPWFSMGSDAGDLNNDGRIDLMASDMSGTTHFKQKMGMGDMNAYGWFLERSEPRQYMRNAVYLNTGTPRFMEVAKLAGLADTNWTWSVKIADLDNDGFQDVFVTNGTTRDWMNSDLQQRGTGALIDSPPRREKNLAFRNLGNLQFENTAEAWGLAHEGVSFGAALADLDRDGDLDLVVNNFEEPAGLYRNRSTHGHRILVRLRGTVSNRRGIGATVRLAGPWGTQIRQAMPTRGFASADDLPLHFGLGDVKKIERMTVQWPSGAVQTFEGLDADRLYTITEPSDAPKQVAPNDARLPVAMFGPTDALKGIEHVERPYDDFTRQPLLPQKLSQMGPGLAWGDIDGDGDDDVYVGGAAGQAGMLYTNEGGQFRWGSVQAFASDAGHEDMTPLFFDADGDNDLDLYVVSGGVEFEIGSPLLADRLYLNDGSGRFTRAPDGTLPDLRDSGGAATLADFDRDGDLDLFVGGRSIPGRYPLTPASRLLRNDRGRFTAVTDELAPQLGKTGLVTAAIWTDVDADGWQDLLVAHEWGPIKLYRNRTGQLEDRTADAGLDGRLGWWNGLAVRDIDHDGDMDCVATNFGLNSKYHASAQKPALLHYGDFDGSGTMRLVEAEYEGQNLFPVRGKSCSTHAMPHLAERFPTFRKFALASLQELYTPKCLTNAHRFEVNALESCVLLNDGSGRFTFRPLPHLVQASAAFGVVLTEVDGDGHADLYLAQNFFGPQRETGRMDGGVSLLLSGAGDGSFKPVWPDRSGLLVPGDAKGLTTADLNGDGWVDFIVGVNDGRLRAFENRRRGRCLPFKVRLVGPAGNPNAIGARVTLTPVDGPAQTAQMPAGGSYLSQSSTDLFFGLGQSGRVQEVSVSWPDGLSTTWTPTNDHLVTVIRHPSAADHQDATQGDSVGDQAQRVLAHRNLAAALNGRGRHEAAAHHLRELLTLNPDDAEAHVELGTALLAEGRLDDAVRHFRRALDTGDAQARVLNLLGRAMWRQGRAQEAIAEYQHALQREPDLVDAHLDLADALHAQGQIEKAVEHYGRAVELQANLAQRLTRLGRTLADDGMREQAMILYRRILVADPACAKAHFELGRAIHEDGDSEQAIGHYERAAETDPGHADALYHLARAHRAAGRPEQAIRVYRQAIEVAPGSAGIHYELAGTFKSLDMMDEAIQHLRIVLHLDPGDAEMHARLAGLLHMEGRFDEAIAFFRAALKAQPQSPSYLNAVAWLLATHPDDAVRDPAKAIHLAERAANLTGQKRADVLDTLAAAYASAGRFDEAVQTARRAESIARANEHQRRTFLPEIHKHLTLYEQGRPYREPGSRVTP